MSRFIPLLAALSMAIPASGTASPIAEVLCAPTAELRDKLARQFRATRQGLGVRDPEQVMELWTDARGDWTMVVTYASGKSCIVAMGEDWTDLTSKPPA